MYCWDDFSFLIKVSECGSAFTGKNSWHGWYSDPVGWCWCKRSSSASHHWSAECATQPYWNLTKGLAPCQMVFSWNIPDLAAHDLIHILLRIDWHCIFALGALFKPLCENSWVSEHVHAEEFYSIRSIWTHSSQILCSSVNYEKVCCKLPKYATLWWSFCLLAFFGTWKRTRWVKIWDIFVATEVSFEVLNTNRSQVKLRSYMSLWRCKHVLNSFFHKSVWTVSCVCVSAWRSSSIGWSRPSFSQAAGCG